MDAHNSQRVEYLFIASKRKFQCTQYEVLVMKRILYLFVRFKSTIWVSSYDVFSFITIANMTNFAKMTFFMRIVAYLGQFLELCKSCSDKSLMIPSRIGM